MEKSRANLKPCNKEISDIPGPASNKMIKFLTTCLYYTLQNSMNHVWSCMPQRTRDFPGTQMWALPIWVSGGEEDGVMWVLLLRWHSSRLAACAREHLWSPAGVLGGVGMTEMSSGGGTANTTGLAPLDSLLISSTWIGASWLRNLTWYLFFPVWAWIRGRVHATYLTAKMEIQGHMSMKCCI